MLRSTLACSGRLLLPAAGYTRSSSSALLENTIDGTTIERSRSDGRGRKRHSRRTVREQREKGLSTVARGSICALEPKMGRIRRDLRQKRIRMIHLPQLLKLSKHTTLDRPSTTCTHVCGRPLCHFLVSYRDRIQCPSKRSLLAIQIQACHLGPVRIARTLASHFRVAWPLLDEVTPRWLSLLVRNERSQDRLECCRPSRPSASHDL